jgi:hypothetical protein
MTEQPQKQIIVLEPARREPAPIVFIRPTPRFHLADLLKFYRKTRHKFLAIRFILHCCLHYKSILQLAIDDLTDRAWTVVTALFNTHQTR